MSRGERTTVLRIYISDAVRISNGLHAIRKDNPRATTADVIKRMIEENKRMKARIAYLNLGSWGKCNSKGVSS